MYQFVALGESPFPNLPDVRSSIDAYQFHAFRKRIIRNRCHTIWNRNELQIAASFESVRRNLCHPVRNTKIRSILTIDQKLGRIEDRSFKINLTI